MKYKAGLTSGKRLLVAIGTIGGVSGELVLSQLDSQMGGLHPPSASEH